MALWTIGDPHLSLGCDKPMDIFRGWDGYVDRLTANWRSLVGEQDTVVIPGDVSWGMSLEQAEADFAFLHALPGQKLLLKGNHDYWWTTRRKMDAFFAEHGFTSLRVVHNDAVDIGDGRAVCGTRGWFYDAESDADHKVLAREVGRLNASIDAAEALGCEPLVFLHYPPLYADAICEELFSVLRDRHIRTCYYGHIHSHAIRRAFNGERDGVKLKLVSADALSFCPLLI